MFNRASGIPLLIASVDIWGEALKSVRESAAGQND